MSSFLTRRPNSGQGFFFFFGMAMNATYLLLAKLRHSNSGNPIPGSRFVCCVILFGPHIQNLFIFTFP